MKPNKQNMKKGKKNFTDRIHHDMTMPKMLISIAVLMTLFGVLLTFSPNRSSQGMEGVSGYDITGSLTTPPLKVDLGGGFTAECGIKNKCYLYSQSGASLRKYIAELNNIDVYRDGNGVSIKASSTGTTFSGLYYFDPKLKKLIVISYSSPNNYYYDPSGTTSEDWWSDISTSDLLKGTTSITSSTLAVGSGIDYTVKTIMGDKSIVTLTLPNGQTISGEGKVDSDEVATINVVQDGASIKYNFKVVTEGKYRGKLVVSDSSDENLWVYDESRKKFVPDSENKKGLTLPLAIPSTTPAITGIDSGVTGPGVDLGSIDTNPQQALVHGVKNEADCKKQGGTWGGSSCYKPVQQPSITSNKPTTTVTNPKLTPVTKSGLTFYSTCKANQKDCTPTYYADEGGTIDATGIYDNIDSDKSFKCGSQQCIDLKGGYTAILDKTTFSNEGYLKTTAGGTVISYGAAMAVSDKKDAATNLYIQGVLVAVVKGGIDTQNLDLVDEVGRVGMISNSQGKIIGFDIKNNDGTSTEYTRNMVSYVSTDDTTAHIYGIKGDYLGFVDSDGQSWIKSEDGTYYQVTDSEMEKIQGATNLAAAVKSAVETIKKNNKAEGSEKRETCSCSPEAEGCGGDTCSKERLSRLGSALEAAFAASAAVDAISSLFGINADITALVNFFEKSVFGQLISGRWESMLCRGYVSSPPAGTLIVDAPDGITLVQTGAHINGQKIGPITHPDDNDTGEMITEYLYKIEVYIKNPEQRSGSKNDVPMNYKVIIYPGGKLITSGSVTPGQTFSRTGSSAFVKYSKYSYEKVCIHFNPGISTTAEGSKEEICNTITGAQKTGEQYTLIADSTASGGSSDDW